MIEFHFYTANQLLEWTNSGEYRNQSVVPVSRHRALSYMHNPRLRENDIVAIIVFENKEVVAFRTLLPDDFYLDGKKIHFAWLSGNWVKPSLRRSGLSTQLFNLIGEKWDYHLAYTNYAPISKAVYDKTGGFRKIATLKGRRYYFRSCLSLVLPPKSMVFENIKGLFKFIDAGVNLILKPVNYLRQLRFGSAAYNFEYAVIEDPEIKQFIEKSENNTACKRSADELCWIVNYPWVIHAPFQVEKKYPFSAYSKQAFSLIIKLIDQQKVKAVLLMHINGSKMTVPYYFTHQNDLNRKAAKVILMHCNQLNINYLTVYNADLTRAMDKMSSFYFFSKSLDRNFFAHNKLLSETGDGPLPFFFSDGDGDCAFT